MLTADQRIHAVSRLGLVTRAQLHAAGVTEKEARGRLERGSLRTIHPGVYATFGTRLDYPGRLRAACLAAGPEARSSHRAGLATWVLLDGPQPVEITALRWQHPVPDGFIIHRPNVLRPQDGTVRQHVPVTNPLRTLLDTGAVIPKATVADCVERALLARLVTTKGLRLILAELGGRGRSGTGALRWSLDRRALGDRRPESMIEPLMARLLYEALGIGPVEYQPSLTLAGQRVRPDFRVPLAMVVVEVDGLDAHASREALDSDLARQNLFVRHGYLVLRYTITQLRRPARVTAEVRTICLQRIEQLARLTA